MSMYFSHPKKWTIQDYEYEIKRLEKILKTTVTESKIKKWNGKIDHCKRQIQRLQIR